MLHPDTAKKYNIKDGEWCYIKAPRGNVKMVAKVTDRLKPNILVARHGWWFPEDESNTEHWLNESNVNLITYMDDDPLKATDKVLGTEHMKCLLCTLEKAPGPQPGGQCQYEEVLS